MTGRGRRSPPVWLGRLAIGCLSVTLLLLTCGCGFFLPGGGQVTRPTREEQNLFYGESKDERALNKRVDPFKLVRFINGGSGVLCDLAAERGLTPQPAEFFTFLVEMPSTFDSDKQKGTDRYLAGKLAESTQNGYDFSPFSGEKLVGQAYVFSGVGTLVSYIVLLDGDAQIIGLWEDTYAPTAADAEAGTHWTFFNRVDD
ncbi:MAG: hypothetical protein GX153_08390 [Clostridiaceae bacterium]|jgi:hypothetical protein|nr:hypothetical protein [Clostridiaceae bacterium]